MNRAITALCQGAVLSGLLGLSTSGALADDWYLSRYGADDTLGAANNLSADGVTKAAR